MLILYSNVLSLHYLKHIIIYNVFLLIIIGYYIIQYFQLHDAIISFTLSTLILLLFFINSCVVVLFFYVKKVIGMFCNRCWFLYTV